MLYNRDGTQYSRESIEEIFDKRFEEADYPYLSDILGSDWGVSMRWKGGTKEQYREAASRMAEIQYGTW